MKTSPNKLAWLGFALGTAAIAPRLLFAMQMDHTFHHYLGWMLTKGGLPYVATYDQNFPMGAVIHAFVITVFGTAPIGFACFDFLIHALVCYQLARLALRFDATGAASLIAPLLYGLTYIGLGVWNTGQRDGFVAPMLGGFLMLLMSDKPFTHARWFALGLLVGMMTLTRPMFILVGGIALYVLGAKSEWKVSAMKDNLFSMIVGAALLPSILFAVYTASGHFSDLYNGIITFNLEVYGKFRHGVNYRGSNQMTIFYITGIFTLLFLLVSDRFRKSEPQGIASHTREMLLIVAAALIAPISTFIQGQGDAHHMVPTYAAAAIVAALGISELVKRTLEHKTLLRIPAIALMTLVMIAAGWQRLPHKLISMWMRGASLREMYAVQQAAEMNLSDEMAVSDYIKPRVTSGDHLQIWSMRIWPYILTNCPASSRFESHEHLLMQPNEQPLTPLQVEWRKEFMHDVYEHAPKFVLTTTTDHLWMLPGCKSSKEELARFPEFNRFVEEHYKLDTTIGAYEVYALRSSPSHFENTYVSR